MRMAETSILRSLLKKSLASQQWSPLQINLVCPSHTMVDETCAHPLTALERRIPAWCTWNENEFQHEQSSRGTERKQGSRSWCFCTYSSSSYPRFDSTVHLKFKCKCKNQSATQPASAPCFHTSSPHHLLRGNICPLSTSILEDRMNLPIPSIYHSVLSIWVNRSTSLTIWSTRSTIKGNQGK